jgi:hypothetical protein
MQFVCTEADGGAANTQVSIASISMTAIQANVELQ